MDKRSGSSGDSNIRVTVFNPLLLGLFLKRNGDSGFLHGVSSFFIVGNQFTFSFFLTLHAWVNPLCLRNGHQVQDASCEFPSEPTSLFCGATVQRGEKASGSSEARAFHIHH